MITISRPSDWTDIFARTAAAPTTGVSHRSTTSSRHPGRAIEGNVHYRISEIVRCVDCGGMRRSSTNPHAPRWQDGKQVDCAGREVSR